MLKLFARLLRPKIQGVPRDPSMRVFLHQRFTYTNWRGYTSTRHIIPLALWHGETEYHPGKQWFIKAYDCNKKVTRDFALGDFGQCRWQSMHTLRDKADWADRSYLIATTEGTQEGFFSRGAWCNTIDGKLLHGEPLAYMEVPHFYSPEASTPPDPL